MGQAAQEVVKMQFDTTYRKVLDALIRYRSMPFLELTTVCDIGDDELTSIITNLEKQDLVKVVNREDILEEIVTLKKKGLEAVI
jgi:hypothetical protein